MTTVELRCDANPKKLFGLLKLQGEKPRLADGNLIEMACRDCKTVARREGRLVTLVVHRFDLLGTLIETEEYVG